MFYEFETLYTTSSYVKEKISMNSCLTLMKSNKHGICFKLLANNFIDKIISN
jgi:hypothetical protein